MAKPRGVQLKLLRVTNVLQYFAFRQYGGFALSHDDVEQEYDELKRDLRSKDIEEDIFYSVGFNSPFTVEDRRNEIWIGAEV